MISMLFFFFDHSILFEQIQHILIRKSWIRMEYFQTMNWIYKRSKSMVLILVRNSKELSKKCSMYSMSIDYTLARYKPALHTLIYDHAKTLLVKNLRVRLNLLELVEKKR